MNDIRLRCRNVTQRCKLRLIAWRQAEPWYLFGNAVECDSHSTEIIGCETESINPDQRLFVNQVPVLIRHQNFGVVDSDRALFSLLQHSRYRQILLLISSQEPFTDRKSVV